jgi:dolichol-phosphate mannosyltransferase
MNEKNIIYSLVIPVKNEEENITSLLHEIHPIMSALNEPWEIIVVDDGSTDNTLSKLQSLKKIYKELRILVFAFNAGQSGAFDAGFKNARGSFIITLDGDGQNDPKDIPNLIDSAKEGFDLVLGKRAKRNDPFSKKLISKLSNFIRSRVCKDGVSDTGCSLKLYRSHCLKNIKMYTGMHRFLPALFVIEGYKIKEINVNHRERSKGKSKYHFFNRSIKPFMDMFAVLWMRKRTLKYQIKKEL